MALIGVEPGNYEFYVVAMDYGPSYANQKYCPDGYAPDAAFVTALDASPYAQRNLSLRGLWPQLLPMRAHKGMRQKGISSDEEVAFPVVAEIGA